MSSTNGTSKRMPALFLGHGNPMHAIQDDAFSHRLREIADKIPRPKSILCISAHWLTEGTWVTRMKNPRTIHDFSGFPQALFDVQYPAEGSPELADRVRAQLQEAGVQSDESNWGLDHGTWSVLRHIYPKADIAVVQLSVDVQMAAEYHYHLGTLLRPLRNEGILVIGSGNLVHNLRLADFNPGAKPFPWAIKFDAWVKARIEERDFNTIVKNAQKSDIGKLSIPTPDHWFPLLYVLGISEKEDSLRFEYERIENSSVSMRCLSFS